MAIYRTQFSHLEVLLFMVGLKIKYFVPVNIEQNKEMRDIMMNISYELNVKYETISCCKMQLKKKFKEVLIY